jgi:hypothetical protein
MKKTVFRTIGLAGLLFMQSHAVPYTAERMAQLAEQTARQMMQHAGIPARIHAIMDRFSMQGAYNLHGLDDVTEADKPYRIIRLEPKGWVIVATDDRVKPIIGYSMNSTIDETLPPAMEGYLAWASDTISSYLENGEEIPYAKKAGDQNHGSMSGGAEMASQVGPLLHDGSEPIQWGQGYYFNRYTPEDRNARGSLKGHVPVGCGATAMGQIMRYWKWPKKRKPIPGYNDKTYGSLSASKKLTYDWDKMPAAPSAVSTEISHLLFDAGLAQKMGYSARGSWSSLDGVRDAFRDYFNYSDEVSMRFRSDYNAAQWASMIQEDLSKKRPVFYRGADHHNNNGHFFVIDGLKKKSGGTEYHINWGWHPDGSGADGWFALDALTPEGGANFTGYQMALVHVFPSRGEVETAADLTAVSASVNSVTITEGQSVTFRAIVKNQGDGDADKTTVTYYLSLDETMDSEDIQVAKGSIPALGAGEKKVIRKTMVLDRSKGAYYLGACVATVDGERDTANQCTNGVRLNIVAKPHKKPKTDPVKKPEPKQKKIVKEKPKKEEKKPEHKKQPPHQKVETKPVVDDKPIKIERPEQDPIVAPKPTPQVKKKEHKHPVVKPTPEVEQPQEHEKPFVEPTPEPIVQTRPEETVESDPLSFEMPDLDKLFDFDFKKWFKDFDFGLDAWF